MAEIEIAITADEDDLRYVGRLAEELDDSFKRVARAIAAALPKPRIAVKPGVVLRRKSDGMRGLAWPNGAGMSLCMQDGDFAHDWDDGLDPDEWEVILDVD